MSITRKVLVSTVLLLVLAGFGAAENYKSDEIIVKFKPNKADGRKISFNTVDLIDSSILQGPIVGITKFEGPLRKEQRKALQAQSVIRGTSVRKDSVLSGYTVVKLPKGVTVEQAVYKFGLSADVERVQPNYKYRLAAPAQLIPNDRFFQRQWNMNNTGQGGGIPDADIDAPEAWNYHPEYVPGDPNIIVAVIDTGIYYSHPDLYKNIWWNLGEDDVTWNSEDPNVISGFDPNDENDEDDDGNGYVDDFRGWDFTGDGDNDPCDENYHGTMVAGIIAAVGNNKIGIAGVAMDPNWHIRLMALRAFENDYSTADSDAVVEAIYYAINNGADVINASWGTYDFDDALFDAVSDAGAAKITVVAAAGNDGNDLDFGLYGIPSPFYPACFELNNVISVMASDSNDGPLIGAISTNYGITSVDLAAPGRRIWTTTPTEELDPMGEDQDDIAIDYDVITGTSGAAAHVSGAAAFMKSINKDLTPLQIKKMIIRGTDKIPVLDYFCASGGRLNLFNCAAMANTNELKVWNKTKNIKYKTIQAAIDAASTGNEIIAQTYRWYLESIDFKGKAVHVRSGNFIDIDPDPTDVTDPDHTFITGILSTTAADMVTFKTGETSDSWLEGFSISDAAGTKRGVLINSASPVVENCYIFDNAGGGISCTTSSATILNSRIYDHFAGSGGGIYCSGAPITIEGCWIYSNFASNGGGVYCGPGSNVQIIGSQITENYANMGGGVYFADSLTTPAITGSLISGNYSDSSGAGVYCGNGTKLDISSTSISANTAMAGSGAGVYCGNGSDLAVFNNSNINDNLVMGQNFHGAGIYMSGAEAYILNSRISGNIVSADYGQGGGVYAAYSTITVEDVNVAGNSAEWDGGGIYCEYSTANFIDSRFNANTAGYFGGGMMYITSEGEITNCLFIKNQAPSQDGGGIFLYDSSPPVTNCNFIQNQASNVRDPIGVGGAIACFESASPLIRNCIFDRNKNIPVAAMQADGYGVSSPSIIYSIFNSNYHVFNPNVNCDYVNWTWDNFGSGAGVYYCTDAELNALPSMTGNFAANPLFVRGRLGNLYLSNYDAGQILDKDGRVADPTSKATSPAFDAGSNDAADLRLGDPYSTRTDNVFDTGKVDIGFHYKDPQPAKMYDLTAREVPTGSALVTPTSGTYKQYAQVLITAVAGSNYQFIKWQGTDDDSRVDLSPDTNLLLKTQQNIVTMSLAKDILAFFETAMVTLRTSIISSGEKGNLTPLFTFGKKLPRGSVQHLTAEPTNPSHVVIWSGTDDDYETSRRNQITLLDDPEEVKVKFYSPRVMHYPGDATYPTLQAAIDAAADRDVILISPSSPDEPYLTDGFIIMGKAITITSVSPEDPCAVANTAFEPEGSWISRPFTFLTVGKNTELNGVTLRNFSGYGGDGLDGSDLDDDPIPTYDGTPGGDVLAGLVLCGYPSNLFIGFGFDPAYYGASPSIKNCVLSDTSLRGGNGGDGQGGDGGHGGWPGKAHGGGAALYNGSNPTFINCKFRNLAAIGGNGGNGGGPGGRGGGWYYQYPPFVPYEYPWSNYERYTNYTGMGGAVYVGPNSVPTFIDCTFKNCISAGGRCGASASGITPENPYQIDNFGGAVYVADKGSVVFKGCLFIDNDANTSRPTVSSDGYPNPDPYVSQGGAIAAENALFIKIEDCNFTGNNSVNGGAMYWLTSKVQIDSTTFKNNTAYNGAGIMMAATDDSKIARSTFLNNISEWSYGQGGAICGLGTNFMVADSVIKGNITRSGSGGGIYISSKDIAGKDIALSNSVLIKNCLLTDNVSSGNGAGISANWHADPNIVNCTITNNQVVGRGFGGGLACSYNNYTKVRNSIIWDNFAAKGAQIGIGTNDAYIPLPSVLNISYSLVGPEKANFGSEPDAPLTSAVTVTGLPKVIEEQTITDQFNTGSQMAKVIVTLKEPQPLRDKLDWDSPVSVASYRAEVADMQAAIFSSLAYSEFQLRYKCENQPSFSGDISLSGFNKLRSNYNVAFIEPVRYVSLMLKQGIPLMRASTVRNTYNGRSMSVAIVDTGVDYTHPRLGGGEFPNLKVIGGYDYGNNDADPMPAANAHGTACAGIAAGDLGTYGDYIGGVAYGAKIYALKIFADDDLSPIDAPLMAWDWCVTNQKLDPANPIMVVSNSWGWPMWPFDNPAAADLSFPALAQAAKNLVERGITVLAASGNDGFAGQGISVPAALSNVISVGAVHDTTDKVTSYSNTANNLDILAPSDPTYTTDIVGSGGYNNLNTVAGDYFPYFNGTSAACPFAAGAVACLQSASKFLTGQYMTPFQVEAVLTSTGDPIKDTKVNITKPRINLETAMGVFTGGPIYLDPGSSVQYNWWDAINKTWNPNSNNLAIDDDPCFVSGQEGNYYLSQVASGQTYQSPCVDAGNGDAHDLDMYRHTTSTDRIIDSGVVDLGYHFLLYSDFIGDFNYDGKVDLGDLVWDPANPDPENPDPFERHWLDKPCVFPYWCHEKDLNFDGIVNNLDYNIWAAQFGLSEVTPPQPDPMTWEIAPISESFGANGYITMTATKAVDDYSGTNVQYYFDCITDSKFTSGWTSSRVYGQGKVSTANGAVINKLYEFRVKARDKHGNETGWSETASEKIPSAPIDRIAPTPNPMTWATLPYAISSNSISMVATTAVDNLGSAVQYYFECATGGGTSSAWQSSPSFTSTGLMPVTTYGYRVRARDAGGNMTGWSDVASATTNSPPPPDPNICVDEILDPLFLLECHSRQYKDISINKWRHYIAGEVLEDPLIPNAVIYFRFYCLDVPGLSSPWLDSAGGPAFILNSDGTYSYITYGGEVSYDRVVATGSAKMYKWRLEASYYPTGGTAADRGISPTITIYMRY